MDLLFSYNTKIKVNEYVKLKLPKMNLLSQYIYIFNRRNYTVSPWSLPYVRNWSLKFKVSIISPLSFKTELIWSFY